MPRSYTPREELLKIQKHIYKKNRRIISESVLYEDKQFTKYENHYLNRVKRYQSVSSVEEMMEAVVKSAIVYVGDYHTLNQSQKSFLRILREVVRGSTPARRAGAVEAPEARWAIALEIIEARHQPVLDRYMKGTISEQTFLNKIGFKEKWYFDLWDHFRPLFDFARYHRIPLYGLEAPQEKKLGLQGRDRESAQQIHKLHQDDPARKIFALVGDLHLAPQHLPYEVNVLFKSEKKKTPPYVILYQNSDAIYWKLAEKELENTIGVVKISKNEFCRMHTPPIVAQQSFLNWLEHEEGLLDYADAKETFMGYVDQIAAFLNIKLPKEKEEIEVFTCGDLSFLKRLRDEGDFSKKELKVIKNQILNSQSYTIPKKKFVYLADVSINHAAEEAAHMVRFFCAGLEFPRAMQDAFYANIIHEALAFFGSKIINHRRRAMRPSDYRSLIHHLEKSGTARKRVLEYETAKLFLEHEKKHRVAQAFHPNKISTFSTDFFLSLTHAIAYHLGGRLFYALLDGRISKDYVRDLHRDPFAGEGETVWTYFDILSKVRGVKMPAKI